MAISLSGSESVQNILQGLHKDLVSVLDKSRLDFVSFKFIYLFSRSLKLALDRWGSIVFMKSTPQVTL